MPEFRQDPITGRWVIIAADRAARPNSFREGCDEDAVGWVERCEPHAETTQRGARTARPTLQSGAAEWIHADCPFCAGHEAETPPEVLARRPSGQAANAPGWQVRAVPNKFPALTLDDNSPAASEATFHSKVGCGAHEVIVESPRHVLSLTQLTEEEVAAALLVYAERLRALGRDPRLKYGLLFKNVGAAAGASLEHTHAQLLATPFVPAALQQELDGAAEFHRRHGRCPFCAMLDAELRANQRVVMADPQFVAFCPHASRFGFETWILPRQHAGRFEDIEPPVALALAGVLHRVLAAVERVVAPPAYNLVVHTLPFGTPEVPHYHWHVEVLPSLTKVAGFEWGAGVHINAVPPEEAAGRMTNERRMTNVE